MKDDKLVKILKRVLPIMSILTVFVFVMLINKKSYALFHKRIETDININITTADELPKTLKATDVVKEMIGTPTYIIGITKNNEKTSDSKDPDIREYRYLGSIVKNYIYFNCNEGVTGETATTSNCELWRILGVFKDEKGAEHLKITKEGTVSSASTTYKIGGTTYALKEDTSRSLYFSKNNDTGKYSNDWATAGIMYWLNTKQDETEGTPNPGYLSTLKGKNEDMIAEMKYYLGVTTKDDTPKTSYVKERDVESCGVDNMGAGAGTSGCNVPKNNHATWTGKVALMYPSDYGFSADSGSWDTLFTGFTSKSVSWLNSSTHTGNEWLLSPSDDYNGGLIWGSNYPLFYGIASERQDVRPAVYIKSDIEITAGDGTKQHPYFLSFKK